MQVTPITTPLVKPGDNLEAVIVESLPSLPERSVLAVTSKIVSFAENRLVPKITSTPEEKHALIRQEAELYTNPHSSKYDLMLTVKNSILFVNAGIDESNADNRYVLWPQDPQASANNIWHFLHHHYGRKQVGVILTDSRSYPFMWGVIGSPLAHCGFKALKNYIGTPDLFGRPLKMSQLNVMHSLAAAAVAEMGEGNEQTPLAVIENIKNIEFQNHPPTSKELNSLKIALEDDAYAPILHSAPWKKGHQQKN